MIRRILIFIIINILFFQCNSYFGQSAFVKGYIHDIKTNEPLIGASVVKSDNTGVITDSQGEFSINVEIKDTLRFNFLGYNERVEFIDLKNSDTLNLNIKLKQKEVKLDEVVVSESKFEQKITEVTVSMDIIKPDFIESQVVSSVETVLEKIPGVEIMDGQPSIRGGSGYSYGAGSRVLLLLNDLPLLSPDASDVKWNFLPLENVSQIEIIKGASSVMYGSSALNGVINFRTAFAKDKPVTKFNVYSGTYLNPKRKELIWWDKPRFYSNVNFLHSRKIKNSDFIIGLDYFSDMSYRENEYEKRGRVNINFQHKDKKIENLVYGINLNVMPFKKIDFFLWQNADSGAYRQNTDALNELSGLRLNIDPFITYYTKNGIKHSIKSRYYFTNNVFVEDNDKDSKAQSLYVDYQVFKKFNKELTLIGGITEKYSSILANLYSNHTGNELAAYVQMNKQIKERLRILLGFRAEQYFLDRQKENFQPVFRSGINYQLFEFTFLRASFGQGYRYPSIAEKFTTTNVGALNIFPNPDLKPEKGWSAEVGTNQAFKVKSWLMSVDFSGYLTEYSDMIEFTFGLYKPDSVQQATADHFGFKALNVSKALIAGYEISFSGKGNIANIPTKFNIGYTYTYPVDLDVLKNDSCITDSCKILKYRFKHSFKANLEFNYKRFSSGLNVVYHSKMINIDAVFTDPLIGAFILPGFAEYWKKYNKPYTILDYYITYSINAQSGIALNLKNLLNKEYTIRPGDVSPPRTISVKYFYKL
ncbi:MAG: TonB-dependent receptor [Chlorobi bacterium]|nr:TonB-dependent receptor [Chlorobiota bacterium]